MAETLLVFATGGKDGGGSGFENLVAWSRVHPGAFEVVGVVSNIEDGGVRSKADALGVPIKFFPGPYDVEHYRAIVSGSGAKWVALSGWLKKIVGLDPRRTFNIHPALLSQLGGRFGGQGMYGDRIHKAVHEAFERGEIIESGFSMHFVTDEIDHGPVFFEHRVTLSPGMDSVAIAHAVHEAELRWQPQVTSLVTSGAVTWDGQDATSLRVSAPSFQKE